MVQDVKTQFRTHAESSAVSVAPESVLKPGATSLEGGVLTVRNAELADLIHAKLSAASKLTQGRAAASDADVGVSVKVRF